MARSVDLGQFIYVLEDDREKPESEKTIFTLKSRTVEQVNTDASANIARMMSRGKKSDSFEKVGGEFSNRQAAAFQEVVLEVKNFKVSKNAPRGFFEKYKDKFESKEHEMLVSTSDSKIIRELFFVLHSDDSAEILEEVDRKSHATEIEKN